MNKMLSVSLTLPDSVTLGVTQRGDDQCNFLANLGLAVM